ncbi:chromodomain-helicase-DNA-binding protein 1 [Fusarium proliferatum]|nr:chromodomain-helicase-DNA-binding protein 1 [Fusarium proliferatum]KAG4268913.1 chromodomain-helicase-DNA-binding protein 1 [Fusarium proliferatum]
MMSNSPQMLGQVTRGRFLQPSRASAPAGPPSVAIEPHKQPFPDHLLFDNWKSVYGSTLNSTKATKAKVDDKTSVSSDGINMLELMEFSDVKVDDVNLDWDDIIPADRLAEMTAEEQQKKEEAYLHKLLVEGAPRKPTIERRNIDSERHSRLEKFHKERKGRDIYSNPFFRVRSLQGGQGYPPPEAFGPHPPHRNTDRLQSRLQSTHYTISQDHTLGRGAHEDSLLAIFGERRRTGKPSISRADRRSLQRSPNSLHSLENGNDVASRSGGSGIQKASQDDSDFMINPRPADSKIPEDAVSFPQETATTTPNEGRDRRDEVEFEWVRNKERRRPVQSRPEIPVPRSQQSFRADTSRVNKSGDRPQATLKRRCHSCNRSDSSEWRRGPDGARTLCNACGLHFAKLERKRVLSGLCS